MKNKFYPILFIAILILFTACSKDFLKKYDDRIVGTWRIADVNKVGIGGGDGDLPFSAGNITFNEDGSLVFTNPDGITYQGRWDITKKWQDDDDMQRGLEINAASFGTQQVLSEYYDDMVFVGTDHFKATVVIGFRTYVTHFRR